MQVKIAANLAAEQAITVAKGLGITDQDKLSAIGVAASTEVFKAAVQGPAQPGIPTDVLNTQRRQAGGESGQFKAPEGMMLAAINRGAGSMAKKSDGTPLTSDAEALEWVAGQVSAQKSATDDLASATEKALVPVYKALRAPKASNQGAATADPEDEGGKETAKKGADDPDVFASSALGGFFTEQGS